MSDEKSSLTPKEVSLLRAELKNDITARIQAVIKTAISEADYEKYYDYHPDLKGIIKKIRKTTGKLRTEFSTIKVAKVDQLVTSFAREFKEPPSNVPGTINSLHLNIQKISMETTRNITEAENPNVASVLRSNILSAVEKLATCDKPDCLIRAILLTNAIKKIECDKNTPYLEEINKDLTALPRNKVAPALDGKGKFEVEQPAL